MSLIKIIEANQDFGTTLFPKKSLHTTTWIMVQNGVPHTLKEIDLVEKSNKKHKAVVDKKRREKLFKEEDMIIVY